MRKIAAILLALICLTFHAFCADAEYKLVRIETLTNAVRVRLPLTDVTGKVRVKEKTPDGFGLPVAPSKISLGKKHYLEWQIGYDIPSTNSPTVVPEIKFSRNGETKYGHELAKIIFEAVRLGILSTNELIREIEVLKKIQPGEFEESQAVQVEVSTNAAVDGFQSAVQRLPQFTKSTAHGWVQIQLKQKQRAVGYQAMVYVCLPMDEVLTMDGSPRKAGNAKSKETVYYDFNHENADLLLDIIQAFGLASAQHNEDIQKILSKILTAARYGFFRRQPAMNMPLPSKSEGQMVSEAASATARSFNLISGNISGSNSRWLALKSSTTSVVSARVKVQTEKINLPPGFTLGATLVSSFFWISESSRTSFGSVVQRACGLRCHVPMPLHGASTSTPSNLVFVGNFAPPSQCAER